MTVSGLTHLGQPFSIPLIQIRTPSPQINNSPLALKVDDLRLAHYSIQPPLSIPSPLIYSSLTSKYAMLPSQEGTELNEERSEELPQERELKQLIPQPLLSPINLALTHPVFSPIDNNKITSDFPSPTEATSTSRLAAASYSVLGKRKQPDTVIEGKEAVDKINSPTVEPPAKQPKIESIGEGNALLIEIFKSNTQVYHKGKEKTIESYSWNSENKSLLFNVQGGAFKNSLIFKPSIGEIYLVKSHAKEDKSQGYYWAKILESKWSKERKGKKGALEVKLHWIDYENWTETRKLRDIYSILPITQNDPRLSLLHANFENESLQRRRYYLLKE